jgi:hypothetical protein
MLFDGSGIIYIKKVKKPGSSSSVDTQIAELFARKKRWETKRKRAETAIKKIDRKIRRLKALGRGER